MADIFVKKEEIKTSDKAIGKAIECKQCGFMVESPNLQIAMMKMAIHKRIFKEPPMSVKTYTIYE